MPIDTYQASRIKELIIAFIKARGPSLPVHLARDVKTDPLFVNAFLSELYREGKIKMSNMKIGSSSLYYLPEQVSQLENFTEYLNQREKEALILIKEKKILEDENLDPVTRVALRSIKDFAIPLENREQDQKKLLWKYYLLSDSEAGRLLQPQAVQRPARFLQLDKGASSPELKEQESENEIKVKKTQKSRKTNQEPSLFASTLRKYLLSKEIELLAVIEEKKKDVTAKVRIDSLFGKQEYCLIAKDKKRITDTDITLALQKAQSEKMPALIMSTGDLDKKAINYLSNWKNLVKFEKIKF